MKQQPLGTCDFCFGAIPAGRWYTSKGKPRLHCSTTCKNAANSQAGSSTRRAKVIERIARGAWQNPAVLRPPTSAEQAERARKGRLREVREGHWRNPGLTPEAREINSRPHIHSGPLASAIEKLKQGARVSELTLEEQEAHRAYRRKQQQDRWQAMTPAQKENRRRQWRECARKHNRQLRE